MATTPPLDPPPTVQHKILGLVVHGVGEQRPGATLRSVVTDFFPLIRNRIDDRAGIDVSPTDDEGPPQVTISFRNEARDHRYELRVREVHWARAFVAPSFGGLAAGMMKLMTTWLRRARGEGSLGIARFLWLVGQLLRRALSDVAVVLLLIALLPAYVVFALVALIGGWAGWLRAPPAWWRQVIGLYARFQPSVVEVAVVLALPIIVLLYVAIVILQSIGPLNALLPDWLTRLREKVVVIATSSLGDVWAYCGQPWEASQIRTRFERRFKQLVDDEGADAEGMFVIAHSLGCPVSYEALSGRRMGEFARANFGANAEKMPLHYFTVASALPAIFAVVPKEERRRLYRPLPASVRWHDIYSQYDPIRSDLICAPAPWPEQVPPPAEALRVVNQMDMFAEHTAYWNNAEQVLAPILDRVTEGAFHDKFSLNGEAREYRVRVLAAWKAIAWLTIPAIFALMLATGVGQWLSDWAERGFLDGELWEGFVLTPAMWAAVAAVFAAGAYSSIVKWFWDTWDRNAKYVT